MNKVLIAEPIYHAIEPDVYSNRIGMLKEIHEDEHNDIYLTASFVLGPKHAIRGARDLAIRKALELKATHLFFLDDDITTPRDILARLLECDKPIVGALVHRDNGDPLVWREPKISDPIGAIQSYLDTDQDIGELVWYDHPKTGVFECAAVAVGCMLIKTEVLQSLNDTRWIFNYDETERSMGVRFCRFAQKHGWTVWCLPDSECVQK